MNIKSIFTTLTLSTGLLLSGCGDTKTETVVVEKEVIVDNIVEVVVEKQVVVETIVEVEKVVEVKKKGSLVLTFDDGYCLDTILEHEQLFDEYNTKFTYFMNKYNRDLHKDKLLYLQNKGHEIGHHGMFHKNALEMSEKEGIEYWYNNEIANLLQPMLEDGIDVKTFAFPYGAYNQTLAERIRGDFEKVRGFLTPKSSDLRTASLNDGYFYNGVGNDTPYYGDGSKTKKAMDIAKEQGKDVVLVFHCIVDVQTDRWQVTTDVLREILEYANEIELETKKFKDL